MDQELWKKSFQSHRKRIINSADADDVLLNRLLDHLLGVFCLQPDQKEVIKSQRTARERCGKLLDFVRTEGKGAFDELCNALEDFGTRDKKDLADSMRKEAGKKRAIYNLIFYHVLCFFSRSVMSSM